jgi:hypothetical protein
MNPVGFYPEEENIDFEQEEEMQEEEIDPRDRRIGMTVNQDGSIGFAYVNDQDVGPDARDQIEREAAANPGAYRPAGQFPGEGRLNFSNAKEEEAPEPTEEEQNPGEGILDVGAGNQEIDSRGLGFFHVGPPEDPKRL